MIRLAARATRITLVLLPLLAMLGTWGGYALQLGTTKLTDYYAEWTLRREATPERISAAIDTAIDEDRTEYAASLIDLNHDLGYSHDDQWDKRLEASQSIIKTAQHFGMGALTGDTNNPAALTGTLLADLTAIGDVRDLLMEGYHYSQGQEPDMFLVSLSTIGIATTVYPAADMGVSVTKVAARNGSKLSGFLTFVNRELNRVIDWPGLKRSFKRVELSPTSMKNFAHGVNASLDTRRITALFSDIGAIKRSSGGLHNTLGIMKHIDDGKSLSAAKTLSKRYRHKTMAVLGLTKGKLLRFFMKGVHLFLWFIAAMISSLLFAIQLCYLAYLLAKALLSENHRDLSSVNGVLPSRT